MSGLVMTPEYRKEDKSAGDPQVVCGLETCRLYAFPLGRVDVPIEVLSDSQCHLEDRVDDIRMDQSNRDDGGPVIGNATKIIQLPLICEMTISSTRLTTSISAFCIIPDSIALCH